MSLLPALINKKITSVIDGNSRALPGKNQTLDCLCSKFYFKQITQETPTDRECCEKVSAQGVRVEGQAVVDQRRAEI